MPPLALSPGCSPPLLQLSGDALLVWDECAAPAKDTLRHIALSSTPIEPADYLSGKGAATPTSVPVNLAVPGFCLACFSSDPARSLLAAGMSADCSQGGEVGLWAESRDNGTESISFTLVATVREEQAHRYTCARGVHLY